MKNSINFIEKEKSILSKVESRKKIKRLEKIKKHEIFLSKLKKISKNKTEKISFLIKK